MKKDSKTMMLEHSKAKVELFNRYWSIYLSILNVVPYIKKIYLFDLFAGEGIYLNNEKGSPILAMETIEDIYFSNNQSIKNIDVLFNDLGMSEIEKGIPKVERIRKFVDKIFKPENVKVFYSKIDFNEILDQLIDKINSLKSEERALLFIDPYGYKEIHVQDLSNLLRNQLTEIILFLPISFMYRIIKPVQNGDTFPGSKPLELFLKSLYGNKLPEVDGVDCFIESLRNQFKHKKISPFVDTFTIDRDGNNKYCLFFFTSNKLGLEKMLEAKWKQDSDLGKGFRKSPVGQYFLNLEDTYFDPYSDALKSYLKKRLTISNEEVYNFGLDYGHLPKHSNEVLTDLLKSGYIEAFDKNGNVTKHFYIKEYKRNPIKIVWRNEGIK